MTATLLDGTAVARTIREELAGQIRDLSSRLKRPPGLTVVIVGENPASQVYVGSKTRACEEAGMASFSHRLPATTTAADLFAVIDRLNADPEVDGILVQLPLPKQLPTRELLERIDPDKDVDCFHPVNVGLMAVGQPRFLPCTPAGVVELLRRTGHTTQGKRVTVVGRSNIVGRPLAIMLGHRGPMADATVTVCHTKTPDLAGACRQAEILIAAAGVPRCVTAEMVAPGAVVVDVGVNRVDDPASERGYRLAGDVDFDAVKEVASAITPVPGGVGPMTIAMLLTNACKAATLR